MEAAAGSWRSGGPVEKNYSDDSIVIDGPVPLVNAPRSVRAAGAGMLDDLIEALSRKIDVYAENIEKAKAVASAEASVPAAKVDALPFRSPKRRI
jgi:hypothetical protein